MEQPTALYEALNFSEGASFVCMANILMLILPRWFHSNCRKKFRQFIPWLTLLGSFILHCRITSFLHFHRISLCLVLFMYRLQRYSQHLALAFLFRSVIPVLLCVDEAVFGLQGIVLQFSHLLMQGVACVHVHQMKLRLFHFVRVTSRPCTIT